VRKFGKLIEKQIQDYKKQIKEIQKTNHSKIFKARKDTWSCIIIRYPLIIINSKYYFSINQKIENEVQSLANTGWQKSNQDVEQEKIK